MTAARNLRKMLVWAFVIFTAAVVFVGGLPLGVARAQDEVGVSQGFVTQETDIPAGALVSLVQSNSRAVELANLQRVERLVGVVASKPLVQLSDNDSQIQAITSGTTSALVSDINGEIKAGDKITASPISGVGMKATESVQVIGTAQTDFNTLSAATRSVTDKSGAQIEVHVGLVPVQVNVTYFVFNEDQTLLPKFLQELANSVAGKEVSPAKVLICCLILLLGFVSIGVLLYSSIHSSIISIGRNPLSERAVNKSLIAVILTALGVLLVMVMAIYLILTV